MLLKRGSFRLRVFVHTHGSPYLEELEFFSGAHSLWLVGPAPEPAG